VTVLGWPLSFPQHARVELKAFAAAATKTKDPLPGVVYRLIRTA
jgi:hypothetical protein